MQQESEEEKENKGALRTQCHTLMNQKAYLRLL